MMRTNLSELMGTGKTTFCYGAGLLVEAFNHKPTFT